MRVAIIVIATIWMSSAYGLMMKPMVLDESICKNGELALKIQYINGEFEFVSTFNSYYHDADQIEYTKLVRCSNGSFVNASESTCHEGEISYESLEFKKSSVFGQLAQWVTRGKDKTCEDIKVCVGGVRYSCLDNQFLEHFKGALHPAFGNCQEAVQDFLDNEPEKLLCTY